jgi:hypothetical protein
MRRNTLGSDLSATAREELLKKPVPGLPQPHKGNTTQANKNTNAQLGSEEKWSTKTIRLPQSAIHKLERLAGARKPDREYPWKVQDIMYEALKEYLEKQGKDRRKAA